MTAEDERLKILRELLEKPSEDAILSACVGIVITTYQNLEDFMGRIFVQAMNTDPWQAEAVFKPIRGLQQKIEVVTASLERRKAFVDRWDKIAKQLNARAAERNFLGHACLIHHQDVDGSITLDIRKYHSSLKPDAKSFDRATLEVEILKLNDLHAEMISLHNELQQDNKTFGFWAQALKDAGLEANETD